MGVRQLEKKEFCRKAVSTVLKVLFCLALIITFIIFADAVENRVVTKYYSTLAAALDDIGAERVENDDSSEDAAVAAIRVYGRGERRELVLLRDTSVSENYTIRGADFTLDTNEKSITLDGATLLVSGGELVIEGGGSLTCKSEGDFACAIMVKASERTALKLDNIEIYAEAKKSAIGIACTETADAELLLNNCTVRAVGTTDDGLANIAAFITNEDTNVSLTVNGGTYIADSRYHLIYDRTGASYAAGIKIQQSTGVARLDGVTVIGVHSGISTLADMILTNSHCTSPTHGGMYNGATLYAENTIFENRVYFGECKDKDEIAKALRLGAMYNGSSKRSAVAYLNNCCFIEGASPYGLVVSTNYGFESPSVYISNCDINGLRVDGKRADNSDAYATAFIGENVTYSLKDSGGVIDSESYPEAEFTVGFKPD